MAIEVIVAPRARKDLDDIFTYIEHDNRGAAEKVISRLETATKLLAERPYIGSPAILPRRPGLRKFSVPPYIIFYRVREAELQIVRFLHAARDLTDESLYTG
jgi:toxin ParE1/3/4